MKKKYFKWGLVINLVTLVLLYSSCGVSRHSTSVKKDEARQLQILAVNDMHAAIEHFPRLAYIVDSLRAIYPDMLLLSGGDNQTGNPVNDQFPEKGMPMVWLMNKLGFDLSALGNHEFDVSGEQMIKNIEASDFDYICANAVYKDDTHPLKKNKIFVMPNGLRVAFTSVLYINSGGYPDSHPSNTKGFTLLDPVETAKEEYQALRTGNDLFIYLNHYGFNEDIKLANALPTGAADLIIGGHSHTKLDRFHEHNGIRITQAQNKLKYASLITITVYPDERKDFDYQLISIPNTGQENPEIRAMVDSLISKSGLDVKIATTERSLKGKEQLGYLMVDAQRVMGKADIAVINPGGVRINFLPKGDVTMMDIYTLDPFGNELIAYELTGAELRELLMNAVQLDSVTPLIPSGMHVRYQIEKKGDQIEGVKDIELLTVEDKPLDLAKRYKVVLNSYMATVYQFPHKEAGQSLYVTTADETIKWLKELGSVPDYSNEKRIQIVE